MHCQTPFTIAMQGDSGSGKTSMMNLIKAKIDRDYTDRVHTIWFNTWQYSQFDMGHQLPVSLLNRFANEMAINHAPNLTEKALKVTKSILKWSRKTSPSWLWLV
ncbi:MAG: KAP family NTPase [Ignavibacteriales bacterium]|nr:KAP family NTPase [Ignavibacteriales bacterium]